MSGRPLLTTGGADRDAMPVHDGHIFFAAALQAWRSWTAKPAAVIKRAVSAEMWAWSYDQPGLAATRTPWSFVTGTERPEDQERP